MDKNKDRGNTGVKHIIIDALRKSDTDEVWKLFREVKASTPDSHLAERSRQTIYGSIDGESRSASVGAWHNGCLVAYSLCCVDTSNTYLSNPHLKYLSLSGETLWAGKGTVVRPEYEGRLLMPRLLKARGDIIQSFGPSHSVGLIAMDNFPSLFGALRVGVRIIDLFRDDYCLNYLCYAGASYSTFAKNRRRYSSITELKEIEKIISQGWIGTHIQKKSNDRLICFQEPLDLSANSERCRL